MIKIKYPQGDKLEDLKQNYLEIFEDFDELKKRWEPFKIRFNIDFEELLIGDFERLVDLYYKYNTLRVSKKDRTIFDSIFDYEMYQPKIAEFFMKPENGFNWSTCHYCNMAYINTYSKSLSYRNHLDFINNASSAEWREIFDEKKLSDTNLIEILNKKNFTSLDDFNQRKYLWKRIELYKGFSLDSCHNHFDLDHLLPKSKCPILSLSLFNFVPSCQVCNEKLKKNRELANDIGGWLKISPTYNNSDSFSFENEVTIKLIPQKSCSTFFELKKNKGNYKLEFECNNDETYEKYISIFRLKDRYNYHKELALHILDLKERYPTEKCKEISRLLSGETNEGKIPQYSESQIKEDILRVEFNNDKCFSKLLRDMIIKN